MYGGSLRQKPTNESLRAKSKDEPDHLSLTTHQGRLRAIATRTGPGSLRRKSERLPELLPCAVEAVLDGLRGAAQRFGDLRH